MILRIRNSFLGKATSMFMVVVFVVTLMPQQVQALTGGPAQPEFNTFTPIGTSDMVDLASGDFSYNIPLMDVGGFPINIAYNSGITTDQEASWVGLGWNLSIGQINRQMRGIPDDFDGDKMKYTKNMKKNTTIGGSFEFSPELVGVPELDDNNVPTGNSVDNPLNIAVNINGSYNTYNGISITPTANFKYDLGKIGSAGLSVSSTPGGLVLGPKLSLKAKLKDSEERDIKISGGGGFGVVFNGRQGLKKFNMSADLKTYYKKKPIKLKGKSKISFVKNTYTPTIEHETVTTSGTYNAAIGSEFTGLENESEIEAYFSVQAIADQTTSKLAYGYNNTEKAEEKDILDFNREKDGNFSKNSTNLPITNYTYDIYSIQGQGISGMFHPYRSQVGYVYDNKVESAAGEVGLGLEFGGGNINHTGVDVEATGTETSSGVWDNGKNEAREFFLPNDPLVDPEDIDYEEVYYKTVGDLAFDPQYAEIFDGHLGGYAPMRFKMGTTPFLRKIKPKYEIKSPNSADYYEYSLDQDQIKRDLRVKRNQEIQSITAAQADLPALKSLGFIRNPNSIGKDHHTAGFIITRNDGARYVYGKAIYNNLKKEVTFATGAGIGGSTEEQSAYDCTTGLVDYEHGVDNTVDNNHGDKYLDIAETPEYVHTFLLTSLLSADYSDVDEIDGPSQGDLGSYTKFKYQDDFSGGAVTEYKWRVPFQKDKANHNEGLKTDPTDDKGSYVYGEKELTYLKTIETKTHIAVFYTSDRRDGIGVNDEAGGLPIDGTSSRMQKLDRIELYSIGEYYDQDLNIQMDAIPIKTVHFVYDYSMCKDIPNNDGGTHQTDWDGDDVFDTEYDSFENLGGKLTLRQIFFTYRNSKMGKYSPYEFSYGDADHNGTEDPERNPPYNLKAYDVWGCYKPNEGGCEVQEELTSFEYNYVDQEAGDINDDYTAAWTLTDIRLPSGGEIQIDYESDDYAYVQDKDAMRMFKVAGAGVTLDPSEPDNDDFQFFPEFGVDSQGLKEALLYKGTQDANYIYFKLDEEDQTSSITTESFREKYVSQLEDQQNLMYFRFFMNTTPQGGVKLQNWENGPFDFVTGYVEIDPDSCGTFTHGGDQFGSVYMKKVKLEGGFGGTAKVNPIAKAGWQFVRNYLPKYAYEIPNANDAEPISQTLESVYQLIQNSIELITGPNGLLKGKKVARRFVPEKSWIRLGNPSKEKYGGGCRVKELVMTDDWAYMQSDGLIIDPNDPKNQKYGQIYSYDLEDGTSSGVATYEPVGAKDNPFVQPVFVNKKRLLAPDEQNYVEKPFGESFFPNPEVTYSRVSVKNLERAYNDGTNDWVVQKNATGEVITEFFTSKDYPTITDQTELKAKEDKNSLIAGILDFNYVEHLTVSQGYVVHLNDMDGKMKAQWVYGEDQDEMISGVEYVYGGSSSVDPGNPTEADPFILNVNNSGNLDNSVQLLTPNGILVNGKIGVEQNIINDFREKKSQTLTGGVNVNFATFQSGVTILLPMPLPDFTRYQDKLSMATTTKVIHTYGVLKEVIAHDAGASVYTKNLVWDSETGEVLLTETVNEFGDTFYSLNLPAHWYYDGMGLAYRNANLKFILDPISSSSGIYMPSGASDAADYLTPGDELIINTGIGPQRGWINSVTAGTGGNNAEILDEDGNPLDISAINVAQVIRSGRRNLQTTSMGSVVMMTNPLDYLVPGFIGSTIDPQLLDYTQGAVSDGKRVLNAGAVEFSDDWAALCECGLDTDEIRNPYVWNEKGIWRAKRSLLYLSGRQYANNIQTRNDGFYLDFSSYYKHNSTDGWYIDPTDWTFTSEVTKFNDAGFEIENEDALGRFSAAQYGYNFKFPTAVGANTEYRQIGYDGFEDYDFQGCETKEHFGFRDNTTDANISDLKSHTGKFSLKITAGEKVEKFYIIDCEE